MYTFHRFEGNDKYCLADRGDGVVCLLAPENHELEEAKRRRGGKCYECGKRLTSFDKDHSFCNVCWDAIFPPELEDEDEINTMYATLDELTNWRNG